MSHDSVNTPAADAPAADSFDALLGNHRGTPERDTLAAKNPSPVARARLQHLLESGDSEEILRELSHHRHPLEQTLTATLVEALITNETREIAQRTRDELECLLKELGVPTRLRSDHDLAWSNNTRHALDNWLRSRLRTSASSSSTAEELSSVAESIHRRGAVLFIARDLHDRGVNVLVRAAQMSLALQPLCLPDKRDLENALRDALDVNQRGFPVLDSLSEEGRECWLRALKKMLTYESLR